MEKAGIQADYQYLERLYREMWRRVTDTKYVSSPTSLPGQEDAKAFKKRCLERGVPSDIFAKAGELFILNVTKAIGMGSWGVKLDLTTQLVNASPAMDEIGKRNALRDFVGVRVGYGNVDRYVPQVDRNQVPSQDSAWALLENNDLKEGANVQAFSSQMHTIHLMHHAPLAIEIFQRVETQQVQDPRAELSVLTPTLEHINAHRGFLQGDKNQEQAFTEAGIILRRGSQAMSVLVGMVRRLQAREEELRAKQGEVIDSARQALRDREYQLKALEMQGKLQNEAAKQESLNAMRATKTDQQMEIRRMEAEANIELRQKQQDAEIELMRQKAAQRE